MKNVNTCFKKKIPNLTISQKSALKKYIKPLFKNLHRQEGNLWDLYHSSDILKQPKLGCLGKNKHLFVVSMITLNLKNS